MEGDLGVIREERESVTCAFGKWKLVATLTLVNKNSWQPLSSNVKQDGNPKPHCVKSHSETQVKTLTNANEVSKQRTNRLLFTIKMEMLIFLKLQSI